ncbi:hypothetical protein [Sphingopyxis sp. 2PD]|uniref:hypothetical protein n=1 Tax=Sphingopyxis sp. 2PD TaxID=2502196 RepID=UPI0010F85ED7|nr:hypothetical protein [Sphingopyxis sp. 2PD]
MRAQYLFSCLLLLFLPACTVVSIGGGQAVVHGGNLQIVAPENSNVVAVRSRGFGLVSGARNVTLGYQDESLVYQIAGGSCAIILFDAKLDEKGRAFWRELAEKREDICIK